jgi:hypothetical protein
MGLAGAAAGCAWLEDADGVSYENDLINPEAVSERFERRFTMRVTRAWKMKQHAREQLTIALPQGPADRLIPIDGEATQARFWHSRGPQGCDRDHSIKGSVIVRKHDYEGVRAWLDVVSTCPVDGDFTFHGNYRFKAHPPAR